MDILVADDTFTSRRIVSRCLSDWGHKVIEADNGTEALELLLRDDGPRLAVLDWVMPNMDGIDVCRGVVEHKFAIPPYMIILTSKDAKEDVVAALDAGANDFVTKPFTPIELRARINAGLRVLSLQQALADRVREVEEALERVQSLETLLPICMYCKKVRDDSNYWRSVEEYFTKYSGVQLSHGVCPECYESQVVPMLAKMEDLKQSRGTS